jgi:hypothetical protein
MLDNDNIDWTEVVLNAYYIALRGFNQNCQATLLCRAHLETPLSGMKAHCVCSTC